MLNMMREFGFAPAFNCFTQTWQPESGSKRSAKTRIVDKAQRHRFAGYAARRDPAEMMITMIFENSTNYQRRTRRARSRTLSGSAGYRLLSDATHCGINFVTLPARKQSLELCRALA